MTEPCDAIRTFGRMTNVRLGSDSSQVSDWRLHCNPTIRGRKANTVSSEGWYIPGLHGGQIAPTSLLITVSDSLRPHGACVR